MTLRYETVGEMITQNEQQKSIRAAVGRDMQRQREINMYGMTTDDIRTQYMAIGQMTGLEMVVAGILSDVQELTAYQHAANINSKATKELIRQQLNIAKFVLFEMMDQKETAWAIWRIYTQSS